MHHRRHRFVHAVAILLPALVTASCIDVIIVGSVPDSGDEPTSAMAGGGSPTTGQTSSGSGGGGGSGGSPSNACNWSGMAPVFVNNEDTTQQGSDVAVDAAGNVAVTGRYAGILDLGVSPPLDTQVEKPFVAKFDPCGNALWAREIAHYGPGVGLGVAFDGSGNVIMAGYNGFLDTDILVSKFDPDGNPLWTRSFVALGDQHVFDIAVNMDNDIVIAGRTEADVLFDNGLEIQGFGAFLVKLTPAGQTVWAKTSNDGTQVRAITADGAGNIIVLSHGDPGVFLAKLNNAGDSVWSMALGSPSASKALDVAVDSADAIIVTGTYHYSVDLGGGPLIGSGHESTFLGKFSPAGDHLWSRALTSAPSVGCTLGNGVAVDVDDSIVVGGFFEQTLPLCGDPLVSAGQGDLFLARFDASGTCLTSLRFGGSRDDRAASVGLTPSGSAVLTGHFEATGDNIDGMQVTTNSTVSLASLNLFVGWATP